MRYLLPTCSKDLTCSNRANIQRLRFVLKTLFYKSTSQNHLEIKKNFDKTAILSQKL